MFFDKFLNKHKHHVKVGRCFC